MKENNLFTLYSRLADPLFAYYIGKTPAKFSRRRGPKKRRGGFLPPGLKCCFIRDEIWHIHILFSQHEKLSHSCRSVERAGCSGVAD
jgi:hypothetical protein